MSEYGPHPYVVAGEWIDTEWRALSTATHRPLTREETCRLIAGPRRHPFGQEAYQVIRDGLVLVYPSREAAGE